MPADSSTFVAGHFTVAWTGGAANAASSLDIGTTETGFTMRPQHFREDIRIDEYGDTIVDGIFRGFNVYLSFELVRWVTSIAQVLQPLDSTAYGKIDVTLIGQTMQNLAGQLVLTPVTGINSNLKAFTFYKCIPDGEHGGFTFNSRLRRMTCNFLCMPVLAAGATKDMIFAQAT